jgi:hypothetical protein
MSVTAGDGIVVALAGVYFCYRVVTALNTGIFYGDGDMDVHADEHPTAFALTVLSAIFAIVVCAFIAVRPYGPFLSSAFGWLRNALQ